MRFVFSPPADIAAGLLGLPWTEPLEEWADERVVEIQQRGISRHVVRFVADSGHLYALKEIDERLARREYRLLRELAALGIPAVTVVGVVVGRVGADGEDLDAVLVTEFLDFSSSYRALFAHPRRSHPARLLIDALVELFARLHLAGFYWGDCSLSNTLFRQDAGTLKAYLVDAETAELHPSLSDGQRADDVARAFERVGGELMDLEAAGLLPTDIDPIATAEEVTERYARLWRELTYVEVMRPEDQRYRIGERLRRLNELGFDAEEVELITAGDQVRLRLHTRVGEPGHHRWRLYGRVGLLVEENQARQLLNDIASFRGYLEQREGRPVPEPEAASRWLAEEYAPVIAGIPPHLRGRLAPAEIFYEILEHRWYLSEAAGRDIGTTAAARSYFADILPEVPADLAGHALLAGPGPEGAAPPAAAISTDSTS
jgi:tRNA A-37 threonylcarbamoyl transferase component Bud32